MGIHEYTDKIITRYRSGITSEQEYRADLKILIESSAHGIIIVNVPVKAAVGTPDYFLVKDNNLVGYIEILNIDKPLESQGNNKALEICKKSLLNLMLTNYREFQLYREGRLTSYAAIAEIQHANIVSKPGNLTSAEDLIKAFCSFQRVVISSASNLSQTMASKAKLLACAIENAIDQDTKQSKDQKDGVLKIPLKKQLTGDNNALSNDTSARDLASIYSQTISYGFFAARLYGGSAVEEFSRTNAAEFIPVSYPFLKRLFQYLTRHDLDDRIVWIINDLADLFSTADITAVSGNFKNTALPDEPYKHFHETFLEYYDPEFRKSRSESDKPEPVVAFIKEAIDHCISSNRLE